MLVARIQKIMRSQVRQVALKLYKQQGSVCALCGLPIDLKIKGELVLDHDHKTGQIRGALHRSCNAAEGKVANAAGRWGSKDTSYEAILPWLERMVAYLRVPSTNLIYYSHKTAEELRLEKNAKERKRRAVKRASRNIRNSNNDN